MWAEVDFDSNQVLTEIDRRGLLSKMLKHGKEAVNTSLDW